MRRRGFRKDNNSDVWREEGAHGHRYTKIM
jgi:hypothetical protein